MKTISAKGSRSAGQSDAAERPFSSIVVDGAERAASRAMLYAVGFKTEDFKKPQIGVVSTWSQVTPCNIHIDQLAVHAALDRHADPVVVSVQRLALVTPESDEVRRGEDQVILADLHAKNALHDDLLSGPNRLQV